MSAPQYSPGSLVKARGREWIVVGTPDADTLALRPLSGSEQDGSLIYLPLEPEPVTEASFPLPGADQQGGHEAAVLLRDALTLSLRRGAGPFRSFGQISVEPRAYQLVPLLMALELDPVRLLIADDVGVGKTIEAGLIARELLDRGEIDRVAVLCPPHLVEQWVQELEERFHLRPVAVTAAGAARLERDLPPSASIFSAHPHTVVSLDYIKSERRRADFLRACPGFVIVDEAHTCAGGGRGQHQRYALLRGLAEDASRHLVLLTATPHSGDEDAYGRLLGLLRPEFAGLGASEAEERAKLRERLARYLVQRRRADIDEWREGRLFPRHESTERVYRLRGPWEEFFAATLEYCAGVVQAAGGDERRRRLNFWGTLALMRCVGSSPAAARQALRTRAGMEGDEDEEALRQQVFDGDADSLPEDDVEPAAASDDPALLALVAQADALVEKAGDPKLAVLVEHLAELLAAGFAPVVFCRFIATAHYLARHLAARFPAARVGVVTGELSGAERVERIHTLGGAEQRVLVATDCLSEGTNLQASFDAVVHYDLSWNPTRHAQREGRVDRFGQKKPVVRATLMYGANNPVDGAVLDVVLRKAERIEKELGVQVPVPEEGQSLTQALLESVLLRRKPSEGQMQQLELFGTNWRQAAEKARRTRFAQQRLKPDQVLPEWRKTLAALGGAPEVQRFVTGALARLGAGLQARRAGFDAPLGALPPDIGERLEAEGLGASLRLDFAVPPAPGCSGVQRSHPLVTVLAETLLERSLALRDDEQGSQAGALGRVGCWVSDAVEQRTVVALLRLRHQLTVRRGGRSRTLLVEEASALAWQGSEGRQLTGAAALDLLLPAPVGDLPPAARRRQTELALALVAREGEALADFATARAVALLEDHDRVRVASAARGGSCEVRALLPADVIGVFVVLPKVD